MIKKLKISSICHDLALHYDVKMPLFHFMTFQRTESSGVQVIRWMMEWHIFCERSTYRTVSVLLVDPSQKSSMKSVTATIQAKV